ncbi:MAG: cysteine-rich CWC family protein [Deltaproteobacteria bacterium]|nr:cysteine-rich CWC family protein [Deltaproteobacteria bacterium]
MCPLCSGPNQCALAADPSVNECWCESVTFPRELLDQIPSDAVRKTCVCQKCLFEYQESTNAAAISSSPPIFETEEGCIKRTVIPGKAGTRQVRNPD